uniref:Uncharacterized protein n=1 Tax=Anguilla anguilla TaxID=7936 RepID=A0A0E9WNZ9_ANGAN
MDVPSRGRCPRTYGTQISIVTTGAHHIASLHEGKDKNCEASSLFFIPVNVYVYVMYIYLTLFSSEVFCCYLC